MEENTIKLITIVASSSVISSFLTTIFNTYVKRKKEHQDSIKLAELKNQHEKEIEQLKANFTKEFEMEKLRFDFKESLEMQNAAHKLEIEKMEKEFARQTTIYMNNIFKQLTEIIYRIRNNIFDITTNWEIDKDIKKNIEEQISTLVDNVFEYRYDLQKNKVFDNIHDLKNCFLPLPNLLKQIIENEGEKLEEARKKLKTEFEEIDRLHKIVIDELTSKNI